MSVGQLLLHQSQSKFPAKKEVNLIVHFNEVQFIFCKLDFKGKKQNYGTLWQFVVPVPVVQTKETHALNGTSVQEGFDRLHKELTTLLLA